MVPSSVINELRHHAITQKTTAPLQPVANKSRVTWSIKGLHRPADLPPNPVVDVTVSKPTPYDNYLARMHNEPAPAVPTSPKAAAVQPSVGQKRPAATGTRSRKKRVIHITPMNACKDTA